MSTRTQMSLPDLVNKYVQPLGVAIPWPEEFAPELENIDEQQGEDALATASTPGVGNDAVGSTVARFVLLSTKRLFPGESVVVGFLDVPLDFDGSRLPLVGEFLPGGTIEFPRLQVIFTTKPLDTAKVTVLNQYLVEKGVNLAMLSPNALVADVWPRYLSVCIPWQLRGNEMPALAMAWKTADKDENQQGKDVSGAGLPTTFGPLTVKDVRGGFDNKYWCVLLAADLRVGGQVFAIDGLGLLVPMGLMGRKPKPQLAGAALSLRRGTPRFRLDAALRYLGLSGDDMSFGLAGLVRVETDMASFLGMGAWSRAVGGYSMVFLYGEALLPPGVSSFGPPPFTVRGLAGGFGINSMVRTPTAEQLPSFPLMRRLDEAPVDNQPPPAPPEPLDMLDDLVGRTGWVRPDEGSYWLAAGLTFTSFRFIETKALAIIELGNRVNIMILGRTSISLPKNKNALATVYARLNIDLRLAFLSDEHMLTLEAALGAGSYLFHPDAWLTGGLAFRVWTGGPNGGDFVVTIGGYHPRFLENKPPHYPNPARLGFRWEPASDVVMEASGYSALTPAAIMFGGRLAARYDKGMLSAWFTVHVDALIQWKPFYLDLAAGISIGVAASVKIAFVTVRISIELGVSLQFWTPPTGGHVTVKLWFVEFGFDLGAGREAPPAVSWDEFQTQLPAPIRTTPVAGLLADVADSERRARNAVQAPPLVSIDGFSVTTEAALPASRITINGAEYYAGPPINIRPMRLTDVQSHHIVTVTVWEDGRDKPIDLEEANWQVTLIERDMHSAMFGHPDPAEEDLTKPGLLPDPQRTGTLIEIPAAATGGSVGPVTAEALSFEPLADGDMPLGDDTERGPVASPSDESIRRIRETITERATRRTAVYDTLNRWGFTPGPDADQPLRQYADLVGRSMTSNPLLTDAAR